MIDYKKVIKNEKTRYLILNLLGFIPDKQMIKIQYWIKTGRKLCLDKPERYSEKIQWYKLNSRNDLMQKCSDKYSVREYVKSKGLSDILNESYGVFNSVDEIEWDKLPSSFVFKDTLGAGGRSMVFVFDKENIDRNKINKTLRSWVNINPKRKSYGREWIYEGRRHRIIADRILAGDKDGDLPDYKFFCFYGKVFCLYMTRNYTMHHELGELGFLDRDFNLLPVHRGETYLPMNEQPEKPKNFDRMIEMAEVLSEGFPHVRVDFYNIDGKIVFGEMTFFTASGYILFKPDSFDYEMGKMFTLPQI